MHTRGQTIAGHDRRSSSSCFCILLVDCSDGIRRAAAQDQFGPSLHRWQIAQTIQVGAHNQRQGRLQDDCSSGTVLLSSSYIYTNTGSSL